MILSQFEGRHFELQFRYTRYVRCCEVVSFVFRFVGNLDVSHGLLKCKEPLFLQTFSSQMLSESLTSKSLLINCPAYSKVHSFNSFAHKNTVLIILYETHFLDLRTTVSLVHMYMVLCKPISLCIQFFWIVYQDVATSLVKLKQLLAFLFHKLLLI